MLRQTLVLFLVALEVLLLPALHSTIDGEIFILTLQYQKGFVVPDNKRVLGRIG
jgi:hypothetical protein